MSNLVTVSILNYKKKKYLKDCLDSLLNQTHQEIEIFFIDNNSEDGSCEFVKDYINKPQFLSFTSSNPLNPTLSNNKPKKTWRLNENFHIICKKENTGYSSAHNYVIEHSRGDYVLCLNPDIILDQNYIKNALELFDHNSKIGAITGKLYKWQYDQNKTKTDIIDSCGHKILKSHRVIEWGSNQKDSDEFNKITKIFSVSGAAPIYRKEALYSIKNEKDFFDTSFFAYKEDIDLSWRLLHAGWENYLQPKSLAWHDRWQTGTENSTKKAIQQRNKKSDFINQLSYRNHFLLLYKNEFSINFIIYFFWIAFYEIKKFFFFLFFEPKTLKAIGQAFKLCSLTLKKRRDILKKSKIKPKSFRKYIS